MQLYSVSDHYIDHLKKTDSKVSNNYGGNKPYAGVLFLDDSAGFKWYAPLTSEKQHFEAHTKQVVWNFLVHEHGKPENRLGLLDFRNLIPVPDCAISLFPFSRLDDRYKLMVQTQYQFIRLEQEKIAKKSKTFFDLVYLKKSAALTQMACDFMGLQKSAQGYKCPSTQP